MISTTRTLEERFQAGTRQDTMEDAGALVAALDALLVKARAQGALSVVDVEWAYRKAMESTKTFDPIYERR